MVRHRNLFVLNVEDGLVSFRRHVIQTLYLLLALNVASVRSASMWQNRIPTPSSRRKDPFVTAGDLQIAVAIIRLEHNRCCGFCVASNGRSIAAVVFVMSWLATEKLYPYSTKRSSGRNVSRTLAGRALSR
jgi:hypothetical protein